MTTTKTFITKTYNDSTALSFRNDGWFNMTKAANAFGKDLYEFMQSPQTVEYMEGMSKYLSVKKCFVTECGCAQYPSVGTWAHPKLAVLFGYWVSIKFGIWCEMTIDDILGVHGIQKDAAKCTQSVEVGSITHQAMNQMLKQMQEINVKLQAQTRTIKEMVAKLEKLAYEDFDENAHMSVDEYFDSIGMYNLSDAARKKIEEVSVAYCHPEDDNF